MVLAIGVVVNFLRRQPRRGDFGVNGVVIVDGGGDSGYMIVGTGGKYIAVTGRSNGRRVVITGANSSFCKSEI